MNKIILNVSAFVFFIIVICFIKLSEYRQSALQLYYTEYYCLVDTTFRDPEQRNSRVAQSNTNYKVLLYKEIGHEVKKGDFLYKNSGSFAHYFVTNGDTTEYFLLYDSGDTINKLIDYSDISTWPRLPF